MNIPMVDLMSLLKRLDKSKNGVVIKEEFLTCWFNNILLTLIIKNTIKYLL